MAEPAQGDFLLQGHRGARGLRPENTLPSFELAIDVGANSLETDVHLTADGIPILCHEPCLDPRWFSQVPGTITPSTTTLLRSLTLSQIRRCRADRNPDPQRFPSQKAEVTPLAELFCSAGNLEPFGVPTVADLFDFFQAYAGDQGKQAGKTPDQQNRARQVVFDLELKRVPGRPEFLGDAFYGTEPGPLEKAVAQVIQRAGVAPRTVVRSFDHRAVRCFRQILPECTTAILVANTAPVSPGNLANAAEATWYCPDYLFLDETQVKEAHAAGIKVLPWTVNEPADWENLLAWNVDGITTDYPDRLGRFLAKRGMRFGSA